MGRWDQVCRVCRSCRKLQSIARTASRRNSGVQINTYHHGHLVQAGLPIEQHHIAILKVPLNHIANLKMPVSVTLQEPQVQAVTILWAVSSIQQLDSFWSLRQLENHTMLIVAFAGHSHRG